MTTDVPDPRTEAEGPAVPLILRFGEPLQQLGTADDSRITKVERETTDDD